MKKKTLSETGTNIKDDRIGNDIMLVIIAVFKTFKKTGGILEHTERHRRYKNN